MKIVETIIPKYLVRNSLLSLLSFLKNQKQELNFQQVGDMVTERFFYLWFKASLALLQGHARFDRLCHVAYVLILF